MGATKVLTEVINVRLVGVVREGNKRKSGVGIELFDANIAQWILILSREWSW